MNLYRGRRAATRAVSLQTFTTKHSNRKLINTILPPVLHRFGDTRRGQSLRPLN